MFRVQNKKLKRIVLCGSSLENGRTIGAALRPEIQKSLLWDRGSLERVKNKDRGLVSFLKLKLTKMFPDSIAELRGVASGAKADFMDLLLENCPELLNKEDGCTSAVVKNKKDFFIIHNEDEVRVRTASGMALARYSGRDYEYSAFLYGGELAGNAFGWGGDWFYSVNYLPVRKPDLRGVPRYFVARKLLEQKNINSALKFLRSVAESSGFHYLMGDTDGRMVSVEKRKSDISIKELSGSYCHSNHYIHPKFKKLETIKTESSADRLSIAGKNIFPDADQRKVLKVWRNELRRPLDKKDYAKTFATVLTDLKSGTILIL